MNKYINPGKKHCLNISAVVYFTPKLNLSLISRLILNVSPSYLTAIICNVVPCLTYDTDVRFISIDVDELGPCKEFFPFAFSTTDSLKFTAQLNLKRLLCCMCKMGCLC